MLSGSGWKGWVPGPVGMTVGSTGSAKVFSRDTRVYSTGVIRGYPGDIRRVYKGVHLLPLP